MTLSAGARVGPYEVLGVAGKGGMGEVYRARDTRLGRVVALKVLPADVSSDPDRRKRLEQEARVISSLSEPHICTLFDIGHEDGLDYLVMEFLEGDTLQQRVHAGPLSREQVLRYGGEIAGALDKAHRKGIVHRDLKPGNIMLTKAGATLLDFGLARFARPSVSAPGGLGEHPTETLRLTSEGTILGTWQYMAPEQVEGLDADARTDIFALGAVLYEMATGRAAFSGKSKASLIAAIMSGTPPVVSSQPRATPRLGPAFDRLVQRCLEKDPEDRWQSARDVALELGAIASSTDGEAALVHPRSLGERVAWLVAGLATVGVLALGYAYSRAPRPVAATTVRLSLLPPQHTSFNEVRLSPDGRRIAFTVTGGAKSQLGVWIRSLDATAAQQVPDSADAGALFWSPDSQYVGFFDGQNLKRVEAGGGAPEVLCSVSALRGAQLAAAWSPQGVVLTSADVYTPIQQISLKDCSTTAITALDPAHKEIGNTNPALLPDGRHFLWVSNRLLPEKGVDVYVSEVESATRTLLVHNASQPSYISPGYLIYTRDGKLLAQAFDASTLHLSGDPFPVAPERVRTNHFDGTATYTVATDGTLAYLPDVPVRYQLQWRDRAGKTLSTLAEPDRNRLIQLSPDGHTVLVARYASDTGTEDLWLFDGARSVWRRFTFDPQMLAEARWTPDGRHIIYMAHRDGQFGLYRKAADGDGADELLLKTSLWRAPRALSPDQRFLLFENSEAQSGFDLWVLPVGGSVPKPFVRTAFNEGGAAFSPNGRWVAYVSDKSGKNEIYVVGFPEPGREWKVSTGVSGGIGGGADIAMTWRGNGKELFYTSDDGREMSVPVTTAGEFQAGTPAELFPIPAGAQVQAAADGERFLLNVPADSGGPGPLTMVLHWTPGQPAN